MAEQQPGSLVSSAVDRASSQLAATAAAYDAVADLYASLFRGELDRLPLDQAILAAFAQYVRAAGGSPVAELGCGPRQTTGRLRDLGLDAFGIDISPVIIVLARREHPSLRFEVGSIDALELADGALAGIVSWYSIIHAAPDDLPGYFAEFSRVLLLPRRSPPGRLLRVRRRTGHKIRPQGNAGVPVAHRRPRRTSPPGVVRRSRPDAARTARAGAIPPRAPAAPRIGHAAPGPSTTRFRQPREGRSPAPPHPPGQLPCEFGHLACKVTGARGPARARPLTSASAPQRPAPPGLPRNAIFLSCPCRLPCLLPARRAGEAFASFSSPRPGHADSRLASCWRPAGAGPPCRHRASGPPSRPGRRRAARVVRALRVVSGRGRGLRRGWRSWRRGWVLRR